MDYLSDARRIFCGSRYQVTEEDMKKLAENMALLEKRKLGKLNERLKDNPRGVLATIAEHNFAVTLVSQHSSEIPICYETSEKQRPPDFKIKIGKITYWIQMKDLSKPERENKQDKLIQGIEKKAEEIKIGRFFSCMISDDFKESCLPELIKFIKDKAASASEEESLHFTGRDDQRAEIEFLSPQNNKLSQLTLGEAGDLKMVETTEQTKCQIKQSLLNAAKAFDWDVDEKNINLICMEADDEMDLDICDALYGTEFPGIRKGCSRPTWGRKDDGLFRNSDSLRKTVGVIAIKRKKRKLISDYNVFLYMNNSFRSRLEDVKKLLTFDKVVWCNMRPPMGHGNFLRS